MGIVTNFVNALQGIVLCATLLLEVIPLKWLFKIGGFNCKADHLARNKNSLAISQGRSQDWGLETEEERDRYKEALKKNIKEILHNKGHQD